MLIGNLWNMYTIAELLYQYVGTNLGVTLKKE